MLFLINISQICFSQQLKLDKKQEIIETRFYPPEGFRRIQVKPQSFAQWLRRLPLLPEGTPVKDYTGRVRVTGNDTNLAAVVDYNVKGKKLEQCMDIIFRWRAEYLWSMNRFQEIVSRLKGREE